jgi:hypothetical protein
MFLSVQPNALPLYEMLRVGALVAGKNVADTRSAVDLFKVVCDYCQTWSEPLFPYQHYRHIIAIVGKIILVW